MERKNGEAVSESRRKLVQPPGSISQLQPRQKYRSCTRYVICYIDREVLSHTAGERCLPSKCHRPWGGASTRRHRERDYGSWQSHLVSSHTQRADKTRTRWPVATAVFVRHGDNESAPAKQAGVTLPLRVRCPGAAASEVTAPNRPPQRDWPMQMSTSEAIGTRLGRQNTVPQGACHFQASIMKQWRSI
jgi:hypothetical protein